MTPSDAANETLIDRTIKTWQERVDRDFNREEARQIVENATGFFSILDEWAQVDLREPAQDMGKPSADNDGKACHDC